MIPPEELRHLADGPRGDERPGGAGLVSVAVFAPGRSAVVLARARRVLAAVVEVGGDQRPDDPRWATLLPPGFVAEFAAQESEQERERWLSWWRGLGPTERAQASRDRRWTLPDWLFWLQPDERTWYWWDATAADEDRAEVRVEVSGWPAPLGALEWMLRAAGADRTEVLDD